MGIWVLGKAMAEWGRRTSKSPKREQGKGSEKPVILALKVKRA